MGLGEHAHPHQYHEPHKPYYTEPQKQQYDSTTSPKISPRYGVCDPNVLDTAFGSMKYLDGVWQTNLGEWRNVMLGWLPEAPIRVHHGSIVCDGWVATVHNKDRVLWESPDPMGVPTRAAVEWLRPHPTALDGPWMGQHGTWHNCANGTFDGEQMDVRDGFLQLNAWKATSITERSVTWEQDGDMTVWRRPDPEAIDGAWLNPKGSLRNVIRGFLQGLPVDELRGQLFYAGFQAVRITEDQIIWMAEDGHRTEWRRPHLEMLDGCWQVDDGTWITVVHGELRNGPALSCTGGHMTWNGLLCSAMEDESIVWTPPFDSGYQPSKVWRRLTVEELEGPWKGERDMLSMNRGDQSATVSGATWHNVVQGAVEDPFGDLGFRQRLTREGGKVLLGKWQVLEISDSSVTWGEMTSTGLRGTCTWHRPSVNAVSGPWISNQGNWRSIVDGRLLDEEIVCDRGRLFCVGWVASSIRDNQVIWSNNGDHMEWTRPNVDHFDGTWRSSDGEWMNVSGGFLENTPMVHQDGRIHFGSWVMAAATHDTVTWEKYDSPARLSWRRPKPTDLDGPWVSAEDGCRTVIHGKVQDVPIKAESGSLFFNGWKVQFVAEHVLRWQLGERTIEWQRPRAQATTPRAQVHADLYRPSSYQRCTSEPWTPATSPTQAHDAMLEAKNQALKKQLERAEAAHLRGAPFPVADGEALQQMSREPIESSRRPLSHSRQSSSAECAGGGSELYSSSRHPTHEAPQKATPRRSPFEAHGPAGTADAHSIPGLQPPSEFQRGSSIPQHRPQHGAGAIGMEFSRQPSGERKRGSKKPGPHQNPHHNLPTDPFLKASREGNSPRPPSQTPPNSARQHATMHHGAESPQPRPPSQTPPNSARQHATMHHAESPQTPRRSSYVSSYGDGGSAASSVIGS